MRQTTLRRAPASLLGALLLTAATFLAGCATAPVHPHARVVVVHHAHAHTARCGHYFHRGHWYHLRGHHHRHGCGHHFAAGIWRLR